MSAAPKITLSPILGPNGKFVRNWSETKFKIHEVDYIWVIHNYNLCKANSSKGEVLHSPVFNGATNERCKWYLELRANGDKNGTTDDGGLYLYLDNTSYYKTAMAEFKFSILDDNQKEVHVRRTQVMRKLGKESEGNAWGFPNFIEKDYALPLNDKLTIYCEIKFSVLDPITTAFNESNSATDDSNAPELRFSNDFSQLFNNEEFSDIVVSVNRKNFKAHKLILSTRSPVFAAMFAHKDMKESQENKVIITDFDEQIVEEMLKYIYTGKSKNLNKLADQLFMIAEKYQLKGLKDMSEGALVKNLSVKNVIELLLFADFHRAHKLKSDIIDFIVKKSAQVLKSAAWKNIVVSNPQLVVEVCEALSCQIDSKLAVKST